jgi:hypothetical protein
VNCSYTHSRQLTLMTYRERSTCHLKYGRRLLRRRLRGYSSELTPRSSGRARDSVPSSIVGSRAKLLSRQAPMRLAIAIALCLAVASSTHAGERPATDWSTVAARNPDAFPVVLAHLKVRRLLALSPIKPENEPPPSVVTFHEWVVNSSAVPRDAASGALIVRSMLAIVDSPRDAMAACFEPHHGVVLSDGRHTFDVVLCFKCSRYIVYTPDGKIAWGGSFDNARSEAPTWNRVFDSADFSSQNH